MHADGTAVSESCEHSTALEAASDGLANSQRCSLLLAVQYAAVAKPNTAEKTAVQFLTRTAFTHTTANQVRI